MRSKATELNVFFAYSRIDQPLRARLDVHLAGMKRNNYIKTWFDGLIEPGKEWEGEILNVLSNADVILLLISPDFIASDYCYDVEMKKAIERHEKGDATVIPVILSHCDWKETPFAKIQTLPKDALPVLDSRWYNEDEALHSVAMGIKGIVNRIFEEREQKIVSYYMEIDALKSEVEQLKIKVEYLKKNEEELAVSPKSQLLADIDEQKKLIEKQKITIYELKNKLSEYTKTVVDNKVLNPTRKARITNTGSIYSSINEAELHATLWINQEVRRLAGNTEWVKTGFYPKNGMVGDIVDSFQHKHSNTIVYVLKVDEKYFVPVGERGIELLSE